MLDMNNEEHRLLVASVVKKERLDIAHVLWFAMFHGYKAVRFTNGQVLEMRTQTSLGKSLRNFKTPKFLFIEQNPEKNSSYALAARSGARIMWILEGNKWLGRIEDGVLYDRHHYKLRNSSEEREELRATSELLRRGQTLPSVQGVERRVECTR